MSYSCYKIGYELRSHAEDEARSQKTLYGRNKSVYQCPDCRRWHLATNESKRQRRRQRDATRILPLIMFVLLSACPRWGWEPCAEMCKGFQGFEWKDGHRCECIGERKGIFNK